MEQNYPQIYKAFLMRFFKEKGIFHRFKKDYQLAKLEGVRHIPWPTCIATGKPWKDELFYLLTPFLLEIAKEEYCNAEDKFLKLFVNKSKLGVCSSAMELSNDCGNGFSDVWIDKYFA